MAHRLRPPDGPAAASVLASDAAAGHFACDMVGLPNRQRENGQGGVLGRAGGELCMVQAASPLPCRQPARPTRAEVGSTSANTMVRWFSPGSQRNSHACPASMTNSPRASARSWNGAVSRVPLEMPRLGPSNCVEFSDDQASASAAVCLVTCKSPAWGPGQTLTQR